MKMKSKKLFCAVAATVLSAGSAQAELVAGWDFSDLPVDGASIPASYAANYTGSSGSGTLNVAGDVAASAMPPGASLRDDAGIQGGLTGNGFRSAGAATFPFGTTSFSGGEALGLTARGSASAEFDATVPSASADFWQLSFGARTIANGATGGPGLTTLGISFGDTCAAAASVGDIVIGQEDTEVNLWLGATGSAGGCVVFDVDGTTNQPLLDNVSISRVVPEPGLGGMLVAGVIGLLGLNRRRGA